MTRLMVAIILLGMALLPVRAMAQPAMLKARSEQLLSIVSGPGDEDRYFSTLFLDAVPVAQWRALAATLRHDHGKPLAVRSIRQESGTIAQIEISYQRAVVGFTLVVAPQSPNRVVGLQIVGVSQIGDSFAAIMQDFAALPGRSAFAAAALDDSGLRWLHSHAAEQSMATASSFKLIVLAELARAVAAGEHQWSDVVPLTHKSFSGRLMVMPDRAPMTLHSLASAMIAESDNSAADTLLLALGRDKVDAMMRLSGHAAADRALPVLTTAEAFALKMPANDDLRARFAVGSLVDRRAMLKDQAARLAAGVIDVGTIADVPVAIDQIEWFASPRDEIALLDWLRRKGGDALPIMAINPGLARADAARWRYLGYKGGSEPGVIAMNFLAQAKDGRWFGVSASWNNMTARLDEARFFALMTRAMNLLAQ